MLQVFTKDGTEVGKVTKQWTGFVQEHFTDADNFGINFPMDLDVRVKATMLGALFLIVSGSVSLLEIETILIIIKPVGEMN